MDKKELIKETAIKIIAVEGYHNSTVKMITDKANVSVGTIYNYFQNKSEILNYIFETELQRKISLLKKIDDEEKSLRDKLICFLDNHFEDIKSNPEKAIVLVQESRFPSKHKLNSIINFMDEIPAFFSEMIKKSIEKGDIRYVNPKIAADLIFFSIRETAFKYALDPTYDLELAKTEIVNIIWKGLRADSHND